MIYLEGEDVKQAIVERLLEMFPNVAVYKEATTNVSYPHFFVYQINLIDSDERKDYHLLYYSMEIRYRVASDPTTDLTLQRDLDNIALKLSQSFNIINLEGDKVRCIDKSITKNDGVLQFYFAIQMMVKEVSDEQGTVQNTLDVQIELSNT